MSSVISNPVLAEWFKKAGDYGKQMYGSEDSWPVIYPGSEQHKAWMLYFSDLGVPLPHTLRNIEFNKEKTWQAPCEWPHDQPYTVSGKGAPSMPEFYHERVKRCYRAMKALVSNINDSIARFELIKYPIDIRRRALMMFGPGEDRPALTTISYRDRAGNLVTSAEPFFLPEWSGERPPRRSDAEAFIAQSELGSSYIDLNDDEAVL